VRSQLSEKGLLVLFLVPALLVLIFAQGYPLLHSFYLSLVDWALAKSPMPQGFAGPANYVAAAKDVVFIQAVKISVIFALSATVVELLVGFLLAYMTVGESRWVRVSRTLLILPMVIAPVAVGTMWRMLLNSRAGLVNYALSLVGITAPNWLAGPNSALAALIMVDVWEWTPFVMIIYVAALSSLPADPIRAAQVDGASRWQIFRFITLPLLMPVSMLVIMFRLIDSIMVLDIVYTTTFGGPGFSTHTLSFWIYQQGLRYFNISYAAATSWILLAFCLVIAVGLTAIRTRWVRRHL
jgi:ABC-type sugar transport system permease subunit